MSLYSRAVVNQSTNKSLDRPERILYTDSQRASFILRLSRVNGLHLVLNNNQID